MTSLPRDLPPSLLMTSPLPHDLRPPPSWVEERARVGVEWGVSGSPLRVLPHAVSWVGRVFARNVVLEVLIYEGWHQASTRPPRTADGGNKDSTRPPLNGYCGRVESTLRSRNRRHDADSLFMTPIPYGQTLCVFRCTWTPPAYPGSPPAVVHVRARMPGPNSPPSTPSRSCSLEASRRPR